MLTAINDKDRKSAFKAFRLDQMKGTSEKRLKDAELSIILDAFSSNNQPIEHYLCNDMGVTLMAMDGRITAKIINHFTAIKVPVLTVHDSYIINIEYQKELHDVMSEAISSELSFTSKKFKARVKPTYIPMGWIKAWEQEEGIRRDFQQLCTRTPSTHRCDGYLERLALWGL